VIARVFENLRRRGELALVPYLTAGFPSERVFLEDLRRVADSGADLIEIGVPFSDPIADGPTIQFASHRALQAGFRLEDLFDVLRDVELRPPLVFMSYLNPLIAFGRERLLAAMRQSRVAGLIVPDLPAEEADDWLAAARAHGIVLAFLAAPTSGEARLQQIAARTDGFVYAVSLTGTTGMRATLADGLPEFLGRIRRHTQRPVVVGFGISQPQHVRALRGLADGAVVGSRIIEAIRAGEDLAVLVRALKQATRS